MAEPTPKTASLGTMLYTATVASAGVPALVRETLATESPPTRPEAVNSVPANVTASPYTFERSFAVIVSPAGRSMLIDAGEAAWDSDDGATLVAAYVRAVLGCARLDYAVLSHFHLDHTFGLHLLPKLAALKRIEIYGQPGTRKVLARLLNHPFTAPPAELEGIGLEVGVHELKHGRNRIKGADYSVVAAPLVHADPCWGYRFEAEGKSVAYCTDTGACRNIVELARGADALITECGLLPGMEGDSEWPHLAPETAASLAREAGCKRLFLSHFAAHLYKTMEGRKKAERAARKIFPRTFAARDGASFLI